MREFLHRWLGVILSGLGIVATLWLGVSGQLSLYIHPRYVEFTVIMALIALVLIGVAAGFAATGASSHDGHHDHGHHDHGMPSADEAGLSRPPREGTAIAAGSLLLIAVTFAVLVLAPPATLSSATAAQREMNSGQAVTDDSEFVTVGGDYLSFSVRDWARLLTQVASPEFYDGKSVDITGFVAADSADPDNVYYVSRFVVTCCAVDAQPVGVPIFDPGWRESLDEDDWVRVTGPFIAGEQLGNEKAIVVRPDEVSIVEEPDDPYDY